MQKFRTYSEQRVTTTDDRGAIITRDQFIDFVNWLGMSDVVVKEEGDGWFRVRFVEAD